MSVLHKFQALGCTGD